jgi:hypothetical protein
MGENSRLLTSTPEEAVQVLSSKGVETVIFHEDPSRGPLPHELVLGEGVRSWRLEASFGEVRVFRRH